MKKNTIANMTNVSSDTLCMQMYAKGYNAEFNQEMLDRIVRKKERGEEFFVFVSHKLHGMPAEVKIFPGTHTPNLGRIVGERMKRGHVWWFRMGESQLLEWDNWKRTFKALTPRLGLSENENKQLAEEVKQKNVIFAIREQNKADALMHSAQPDNLYRKGIGTDFDSFEYRQSVKVFNREFEKITNTVFRH